MIALVAGVPETLMTMLMKDNRLATYASDARAAVRSEFLWIDEAGSFLWDTLATLLPVDAEVLKASVLRSAFRSLSFIEDKVLTRACAPPWNFTHGDITAKLTELMAMTEPPNEPITNKMYTLMHKGYPVVKLRLTCLLLGQCSWTSYMSEKLHSSCAIMKRYHPDMGIQALQLRAFCHSFSQFVPKRSREEVQVQRLLEQKNATLTKQTNRITGRRMYFAQKVKEMARANKKKGQDGSKMRADR
eukprot:1556170-Amphidinium_carterae.1